MKGKDFVERVILGMLIGIANMIPGVSGGTIALVSGIYDRLIHAINTIPLSAPITLVNDGFEGFKERLHEIDMVFLVPLCIGIFVASLTIARIIGYLLDIHTAATYSFFFGLILASVGLIYKYIERIDASNIFTAALGFTSAFVFVGMDVIKTNHSPPMIFIAGALAIVTMVLPGISGSFMLVFLQQYHYLLSALNSMDLFVITIFMAGALTGLFVFSRIVEILIKKHRSVTISFLFGLMLGGLRVPVTEAMAVSPTLLEVILPAVAGAVIVIALEIYYIKKNKLLISG